MSVNPLCWQKIPQSFSRNPPCHGLSSAAYDLENKNGISHKNTALHEGQPQQRAALAPSGWESSHLTLQVTIHKITRDLWSFLKD